jgi:hypothetical protein
LGEKLWIQGGVGEDSVAAWGEAVRA